MVRDESGRRHGIRLTVRGRIFVIVAIALAIAAYSVGNREFLLGALLLAALVVIALIIAGLRRPRATAARSFSPPIIAAGGTSTVTVEICNGSPRRTTLAPWYDSLPWEPGRSAGGILPSLAPAGLRWAQRGNTATVSYTLHPPRRGVFEIGPLVVDHSDPFGLVTSHARLKGTQPIIVTPALVQLHDIGLGLAAGEGSAKLVQHSSSGNEDDLMTREYRRGDALRRVHWRASARHGELMVRQEEQRAKPEVRLLVDTRRTGYRDADYDERLDSVDSVTFEWVVRMVASLGVHLHRSGYEVHVVETASPQIAALGGDSAWEGQDHEFLASLSRIRLAEVYLRDTIGPVDQAPGEIFAVVAEPDASTLEWLLGQRRPGQRAVAFVPERATSTRQALGEAGWQCVVFQPDDDLASVWSAVGHLVSP